MASRLRPGRRRGAGDAARAPEFSANRARRRTSRRRRAGLQACRPPPPSPPPWRARRPPRRPLRRPGARSSRALSASARRLGPRERETPGRGRNIRRFCRPCLNRGRRDRRGSYIRAGDTAPRPRRRQSGTGGVGPPRPTCREKSPPDAGSAARSARNRPQAGNRARVRPRAAALLAGSPFRGFWLAESARIRLSSPDGPHGSLVPFNKAGLSAQPLTLPKVNAPSAPGCRRSAAMVG